MRWALHSSEPVPCGELAAHLQAAATHYDHCRNLVLAKNALADIEPKERTAEDERVTAQMAKAIEAAVLVASAMGNEETLLLASLYGHVDPDHSDGIEERLSINVDVAPLAV